MDDKGLGLGGWGGIRGLGACGCGYDPGTPRVGDTWVTSLPLTFLLHSWL